MDRPTDSDEKHVAVVVYLRPDQRDALVELANERPKLRGRATGPVSLIVRELLDKLLDKELAALKRRGK